MSELLHKAALFDTLAVRAEMAIGRDRILDGDVAFMFGWTTGQLGQVGRVWYDANGHVQAIPPRFTGRQYVIVDHLPCGFGQWAMGTHNEDNQPWGCITSDQGEDFTGSGATPELSLLAAMLRVRAAVLREADRVEPVREILVNLSGLAADQVTDEARLLEDLDLDSLDRVQVAVDIEQRYNIDIPDEDVDNPALGTVRGLMAYVSGRLTA
jgi:acyl carrier protein